MKTKKQQMDTGGRSYIRGTPVPETNTDVGVVNVFPDRVPSAPNKTLPSDNPLYRSFQGRRRLRF